MASYPTFDNRWFDSGVDGDKFNEIFPTDLDDPDDAVLTNRAIQGQYNVGSAFKPFVAYSALATGRLSPGTTYNDQGTYTLQSIPHDRCVNEGVRCVFRNSFCPHLNGPCVYGTVNVQSSLAVSSDAFYYKLGDDFYTHAWHPAAGSRAPVRLRRRPGHRPAVRLRRSGADQRAQGTTRRRRRPRPDGDEEPAAGRPPADGDRPGPHGGQPVAARGRLRRHRQRRQRTHAARRACRLRTRDTRRRTRLRRPDEGRGDVRDGAPGAADPHGRGARRADHPRRPPERHRTRRQRPLDDGRGTVRHRLPGAAGDPDRRQDGHGAGLQELPLERLLDVRRLQSRSGDGRTPWCRISRRPDSARWARHRS